MVAPYRSRYLRPADPRLGRHINHDPRSRRFPVRSTATIESVQHVRHVPVFDQLKLGRCVPSGGLGCMATGVFFAAYEALPNKPYPLTDEGAIQAYRDVTRIDPFDGEWEPDDTGSDGLSMAKLLVSKGAISGFTHSFSIDDLLAGLMKTPCIVGTEWTDGMFDPDAEGIIHPTGSAAGGHEYVCDGLDMERGLLWFTNSWGEGWGWSGRFAMPIEEFARLLARDGDATFFTPSDQPAPKPVPVPGLDADAELAAKVSKWARKANPRTALKPRRAVTDWLDAKGL